MRTHRLIPVTTMLLLSMASPADGQSNEVEYIDPVEVRTNKAGMAAHHICSGMFVVGRDYERIASQVVAQDIRRFEIFDWQDDFEYEVNWGSRTASVWGDDIPRQSAEYNGDQGCTILPEGFDDVTFEPVVVPRRIPDPSTTMWPMGDMGAYHETMPREVDESKLNYALDWVMGQEEHNTRALVVVYKGKIIGERYASGFSRNTPQISWSQGKSVASALVGAAMESDHLQVGLDDPAPVAAWHKGDDPRREIQMRDLLQMSSGLDFLNWGLGQSQSWTDENEHFRIYFEGRDVYTHAIEQPMDLGHGEQMRYRNSDPLTLSFILKQAAEARGEEWLTYPQRLLFDRIGARNFVLETDAWGNFIITGYDYGSAWDWVRFGLLHLWDGVWPSSRGGPSDRILPKGWVDFVRSPSPGEGGQNYGGLFWLNLGESLPRAPSDTYYAAGFMGQYTAIIPSYDMVIVRLGPSPGNTTQFLSDIIGEITGAISP